MTSSSAAQVAHEVRDVACALELYDSTVTAEQVLEGDVLTVNGTV